MPSITNFLVANQYAAVTPADTDLSRVADALYVSGDGTLVLTDMHDNVTTVIMIAGGYFYGRTKRVASASTATGIIALYES